MQKHPTDSEPDQELELEGGDRVKLLSRLGKRHLWDHATNVVRVGKGGQEIWRVRSEFDSEGGPFTRIYYQHGKLSAYRWEGVTYDIDLVTGFATPIRFDK